MSDWCLNKIFGCFDQRNKKSYSDYVYMMKVNSIMSEEIPNSACVKSLEFADIKFVCWCLGVIVKEICQFQR